MNNSFCKVCAEELASKLTQRMNLNSMAIIPKHSKYISDVKICGFINKVNISFWCSGLLKSNIHYSVTINVGGKDGLFWSNRFSISNIEDPKFDVDSMLNDIINLIMMLDVRNNMTLAFNSISKKYGDPSLEIPF